MCRSAGLELALELRNREPNFHVFLTREHGEEERKVLRFDICIKDVSCKKLLKEGKNSSLKTKRLPLRRSSKSYIHYI
jgi:hypothetical protein